MTRPAIEIVPYRADWPSAYREIADLLRQTLGDATVAIHHIGSTSVPGLAAKDIIGVQITVARLDDRADAVIQSAGFTPDRPVPDHCPPGKSLQPTHLSLHRRAAHSVKRRFRCSA